MGVSIIPASPDNQAIGQIRDILKESKKQSKYMLVLTIIIAILTAVQIVLLIAK